MVFYVSLLHLMLVGVYAQDMCIPPPCVRTSVQLSSNAANRQGLHYACPGDELTFTCQVFNGAGLQWVNEPKICRSLPVGYTTANREGEMQSGSFYQSYLISVVRNPPFSNFSSNLTFTANASNVTVQCGDQLSSCSDTEAESSIIITDAPVVTTEHLQILPINSPESCPNVSVMIQVGEIRDIAPLTYKLNVFSSDGCALQECPMLVRPGELILNMTLMNGVNYTAMLTVSNDCGSGNTTVSIQPECVRPTVRSSTGISVVGSIVGSVLAITCMVAIIIIIILTCAVCCCKILQVEAREESERQVQEVMEDVIEGSERQIQELMLETREEYERKVQELMDTYQKEVERVKTEAREESASKVRELMARLEKMQEETQGLKDGDPSGPILEKRIIDDGDPSYPVLEKRIIDAIKNGNQSTVDEWLCEEGIRVNECRGGRDEHGNFIVANGTALHWAAYYGQLEIAKLLIEKGADPYQKAKWNKSVLLWLCQCKKKDDKMLQLLLDKYRTVSLVNDPDCDGKTPLHYACYNNNKELVKQLLQAGADPNARDETKLPPLVPVSWLCEFQDIEQSSICDHDHPKVKETVC